MRTKTHLLNEYFRRNIQGLRIASYDASLVRLGSITKRTPDGVLKIADYTANAYQNAFA